MAAPRRSSKNDNSGAARKKSLPGPTTPTKVITAAMVTVCKKYLFVDTSVKIGIYSLVVVLGSFVCDLFPIPKFYLSHKDNFFNRVFVKWSWGWTFLLMCSFIGLTSFIRGCADRYYVGKQLVRLAIATCWWYVCTTIFERVEHQTGQCTLATLTNKRSCFKLGHVWLGLDISGHTFLLIHCLLFMYEEAKVYKGWEKIPDVYNGKKPSSLDGVQLAKMKDAYDRYNMYLKVMVVWLMCLVILWEAMLLLTTLYHHTIVEKVSGCCIAVLCWFVTYQIYFRIKGVSPGLPGDGTVCL